eukprot:362033-Chlamydomonas_euryale.AAC.1
MQPRAPGARTAFGPEFCAPAPLPAPAALLVAIDSVGFSLKLITRPMPSLPAKLGMCSDFWIAGVDLTGVGVGGAPPPCCCGGGAVSGGSLPCAGLPPLPPCISPGSPEPPGANGPGSATPAASGDAPAAVLPVIAPCDDERFMSALTLRTSAALLPRSPPALLPRMLALGESGSTCDAGVGGVPAAAPLPPPLPCVRGMPPPALPLASVSMAGSTGGSSPTMRMGRSLLKPDMKSTIGPRPGTRAPASRVDDTTSDAATAAPACSDSCATLCWRARPGSPDMKCPADTLSARSTHEAATPDPASVAMGMSWPWRIADVRPVWSTVLGLRRRAMPSSEPPSGATSRRALPACRRNSSWRTCSRPLPGMRADFQAVGSGADDSTAVPPLPLPPATAVVAPCGSTSPEASPRASMRARS